MKRLVQAFCGMLAHSIWQGMLFTIITTVVLILTRRSRAALRYSIIFFLFFLLSGIFALTFIWQWNIMSSEGAGSLNGPLTFSTILFHFDGLKSLESLFTDYVSANAPLIVMLWLIIFSFKCFRMAGALIYNERLRSQRVYSAPAYWTDRIELLARQLQLKKVVQLLESEIIKMPVVIGHLKPVILIPLGLLSHLPPAQIEAVLLHELAHIRRSDYIVNFLQHIMEMLFFFNPGLLWISSLLREERENCCDDMALSQTKNKKQFIQALVRFKELALYPAPYAPAFPGKRNQLLQRVTRLIHNRNKPLNLPEKIFFAGSLILLSLIAVSAANTTPVIDNRQATYRVAPAKEVKKESPVLSNLESTIMDRLISEKEKRKNSSTATAYYYKRVIKDNKREFTEDRQQTEEKEATMITDVEQAEADRKQSLEDFRQAEADRVQAFRDHEQAEMERTQSIIDKEQAETDRQMALKDRQKISLKEHRYSTAIN